MLFVLCAGCLAASTSHAEGDPYDAMFADSFDDARAGVIQNVEIDLPGAAGLIGRLYGPAHPSGAAVVMMHGCSGLWRHDEPMTVANGAIEKWGLKLAESGHFALAIDSYTTRRPEGTDPAEFQHQCSGDTYAGYVDPYTVRVADMDVGVAWLRYRLGFAATSRIAALGWSQGAQSVLVRSAETYPDENVSRFGNASTESIAQIASVAFYPGCGTNLGFVGDGGLAASFWRPHRDLRLNHAGADPLHESCAERVAIARDVYGADDASDHRADYIEYPQAHHSFDGAVNDWPAERCAPDAPPSDECAARDADIASLEFLQSRLAPSSP